MKKSELQSLTVGMWIVSKKDNSKHQITAVVEETGKIGLDGHKVYTFSTIQRWYDVAKAQNGGLEPEDIVTEDTTQVEDTDTTADTEETEVQVEQQDTTVEIEVVEGNTATTNTTTYEATTQQNNLIQSLNNLMDLHGVKMEAKKEYIKVSMEGKRGALCMIRNSRYGSLHIDMKSKVFAQLTEEYRDLLIEQYGCRVYDASRGYMRVFDCNDIEVLRTIILTAKSIA